jgi:putative transposase
MTSYRQALYHIIFRTKSNMKTLSLTHSEELYKYIWGFLKNKKCHLYRINGMENHIHILTDINVQIAIADLMRDLKASSSGMLKKNENFPNFIGWAEGYAIFTYSFKDKDKIIEYIKNQREHHKTVSFEDEMRTLLTEHGIEFDEKYFLL